MNPAATLIKLQTFDGNQWSAPFVVSEGMYNSDNNRVYLDKDNRLYVFWLFNNQLIYYRYLQFSTWSEIICPYPGDHDWMLFSAVIDEYNNIHCVGYYSDPGPPVFPQSIVYFKYDSSNNYWTDNTAISINAAGGGLDIDIDNQNHPHVAYRQSTIGGPAPYNDSTMYTFFNGSSWTEPDLVVNDPFEQQITIDLYNRVHIIDREKLETGYMLVHYQKVNDLWQGYVVDNTIFYLGSTSLLETNQKLYIAYYWSNEEGEGDIRFSSYDIITGKKELDKQNFIRKVNIYPNPFKTETSIEFTTSKHQQLDLSIYDLNGKQIKTIEQTIFSPGEHQYKWNGTDKNGKEVTPGTYLIRLQADRHVISKPVEKVK
jgi:hypothetical protein